MKVTNKELLKNWIYILIIMFIGLISIGAMLIVSGNILTTNASESFYQFNLDEKKDQLEIEILNRIDEINREREHILDDEKTILRNKIIEMYSLLLQKSLNEITDPEEKRREALRYYEESASEDEDYLYFVIDTKGVLLRSGTDKSIDGTNLYDSMDKDGTYYIREVVEAVNYEEGLFVDYYWPKVKDGEPLKKTSYCLYLPEFDFIIGTGSYHEDIQAELQDYMYEHLQSYYENKENYIFVSEYDSIARVAGDPEIIGQKMSHLVDVDGKSIHELFMDVINNEGLGFASYQYYKRDEEILSEKISYVHEIEEWNAYIGMGIYVDDLNHEVNNYSILFKKHYYNEALYLTIGLILLSIIIYAFFQRGAYIQKRFLKQGDVIFEQLFDLSDEGIIVLSNKSKLLYRNDIINKIFHSKLESYIVDHKINLEHVDGNIYTFASDIDRKYYITKREESVSFRGEDSIIYFIKDITQQYVEANSLEQMAFNDELTGLPNRRSLNDDVEDMCFDLSEKETFVLAMLDIDNFKLVNDTYGHKVGDEVLKAFGQVFRQRLRHHDSLYRYGGEEFIVLLREVDIKLAQKILTDIDGIFCDHIEKKFGFKCTYSAGLVMIDFKNKDMHLSNHVQKADQLLYKAKQNGRNRVEV